jgi:selenide,water dikinase
VLSDWPVETNDRVLVDFRTADDAGVYRIGGTEALVQTVDFFTPIVDDPRMYGQIAAANAVSDVYAMGGRPLTALAVAAFPGNDFDASVVRAIFLGGLEKLTEAGAALLGGHTVQDREVKFGYAVTGMVDPQRIWANAGAQPGDVLLLTKAIGTGVIATAAKFQRAPADVLEAAVASMTTLNRAAAEALAQAPGDSVRACTDVTGYGLLGHASEMAAASNATVEIDTQAIPLLPGARSLVARNQTGGGKTNEAYFGSSVDAPPKLESDLLALLYDPQTSGGLLAAVSSDQAEAVLELLRAAGVAAVGVGRVQPQGRWRVRLL